MGLNNTKTLLILGVLAAILGVAPLPTAQGLCAPTAETFGVTEAAGHYLKNSFILIGTTTQTESFAIWEENNNIPGLQTTRAEACDAKPDTNIAGFSEGATAQAAFYACTTGYVPYCPLGGS